jgi:hypothetical protein
LSEGSVDSDFEGFIGLIEKRNRCGFFNKFSLGKLIF